MLFHGWGRVAFRTDVPWTRVGISHSFCLYNGGGILAGLLLLGQGWSAGRAVDLQQGWAAHMTAAPLIMAGHMRLLTLKLDGLFMGLLFLRWDGLLMWLWLMCPELKHWLSQRGTCFRNHRRPRLG